MRRCGRGWRGPEAPRAWFPHRLGREAWPRRTSTPTTPATMGSSDRQPGQPAPDTARRLDLCVRAPPTAASQARRALRRLGLPRRLADDAQLAVSELVTNSVRHAKLGPDDLIRITVDWSPTRLRVQVRDGGRHPRPTQVSGSIHPTPGAQSGWGLYLVDRLSRRG